MVIYRLPEKQQANNNNNNHNNHNHNTYHTNNNSASNHLSTETSSASTSHRHSRRANDHQQMLLLHSVIAFDDATMKQIEALGQPSVILVPSPTHRTDAAVYKQRYPNAKIICPKEIMEQVSEIVPVDGTAKQVLTKEFGINCVKPHGLRLPGIIYFIYLDVLILFTVINISILFSYSYVSNKNNNKINITTCFFLKKNKN